MTWSASRGRPSCPAHRRSSMRSLRPAPRRGCGGVLLLARAGASWAGGRAGRLGLSAHHRLGRRAASRRRCLLAGRAGERCRAWRDSVRPDRDQWKPALQAAGLDHRTPYALRHTFVSECIAAGIATFEIARMAGTSVLQIEKTYGHLLPDALERGRAALEAFDARANEAFGQLSGNAD